MVKRELVKWAIWSGACGKGISYLNRPGSFRDRWSRCTHGTWMAWLLWAAAGFGFSPSDIGDDLMNALRGFVDETFGREPYPLEYLADTQEIHLDETARVRGWNKKLAVLIRANSRIEDVEAIILEGMSHVQATRTRLVD